MSLGNDYCKEIAEELLQIPVYLPGTPVAPGDIIKFNKETLFGMPKPRGSFQKKGNLRDLGIDLETEGEPDSELDSFVYASKGSVDVSFNANANAGNIGEGKITIGFKKEGATYLSAVDCKISRFKSIIGLENELRKHQEKLEWDEHFIVIAVTTATKALIMQSNSSSSTLEIEGKVKNLVPTNTVLKDIDASIELKVSSFKEASFIKDWSDNVTVFFQLVRYKKSFLGSWGIDSKALVVESFKDKANVNAKSDDSYILDLVSPAELGD